MAPKPPPPPAVAVPTAPKIVLPARAGAPPVSPNAAKAITPAKSFTIQPWANNGGGERIIIYSPFGMGKSTLASLLPDCVFIGFDDGARKIRHPATNKPVNAIPACKTFADLRAVLAQPGMFKGVRSLVIDTITKVQALAEPYMFETIPHEKGHKVRNLEGYGFGKGYRHLHDTIRLLCADLDALIEQGVNVVLLAQESEIELTNSGGLNYLQSGPDLAHNKQGSPRNEIQQWADHIFRIAYQETAVAGEPTARAGKIRDTEGANTRVIFTHPARHFSAKTRPILNPHTQTAFTLDPVISFADPTDDSLWQFMWPSE